MRFPRIRLPRPLAAVLAIALAGGAELDPGKYLQHIRYLASDELRGRGSGTPELEKAADYIAAQFRAVGLRPPSGHGYLQPLPITVNAQLGSGNRFRYRFGQAPPQELQLESDFQPFNFSSMARISGPLVFAGYGITAPEYDYDDYAGIDVREKIVLVLRHEPQEFDDRSVFAGKIYTQHAQFPRKAANALLHGARGVVFVSDTPNHPGTADPLETFGQNVGPHDAGLPCVQVRAAVAERWLGLSGKSLKDLVEQIDRDLRPRSFALPAELQVAIESDLRRDVKVVHNVMAYLPGATPEYVVLGAHYDHLGLGEQFSMAPAEIGTPHHGADDNASGTAGVLELARWFARRPAARRGILFLAFTGEELGLLGSSYYVDHPVLPLEQAVAMINLDMIGRIRDGRVMVGGTATGSTFEPLLARLASHSTLKLALSDQNGYGSSDHVSFITRHVPVLLFFSGLHADYHRPSDTWDKIDSIQAARLLDLIAELTTQLVESPTPPQFVRPVKPLPRVAVQGKRK